MYFRLDGKVAVITGGTGGIGSAIALRLWQAGSCVVVLGRDKGRGKKIINTLLKEKQKKEEQKVLFFHLDVTHEKSVVDTFSQIKEKLGRIDILINCAGIEQHGNFEDISSECWQRTLDVNLTGVFLCSRAVIPVMKKQKNGRIVNIASGGGMRGRSGMSNAYGAAKAGVINLTQSLAVQLGPFGIRVNALCPGLIETPMTAGLLSSDNGEFKRKKQGEYPLRRLGEPDDVAFAALFLCADEASWISGVALPVDGGRMAM
jgi:3-oxoacyl-[acyl-carrier protein] reductase